MITKNRMFTSDDDVDKILDSIPRGEVSGFIRSAIKAFCSEGSSDGRKHSK